MKIVGVSAAYNDEETLPEFFSCLDKLYPSLDYHIFVTNNCIDKTDEIIDERLKTKAGKRISYNAHKDFVKNMGDPYVACAVPWQRGLREVREMMKKDGDITHALYLDTDIFILDTEALIKATKYNTDILCGSYLRDFPEGRFLATSFQVNNDVVRLIPNYRDRRGEFLRFDRIFYNAIRPYASSAGFMLLNRDVVLNKDINFFPIYKMSVGGQLLKEVSPEFGYQIKARELGYDTWLDGTITLSHYINPRHRAWRSDGQKYVDFIYQK